MKIFTEGKYILVNKEPINCMDLMKWGEWMEKRDRIIKQEYVGKIFISTVFLGIDHAFGVGKKPILFETMIFKDQKNQDYQTRCATYDEALKMHKKAVKLVKKRG